MKLSRDLYRDRDALVAARDLLGKTLVTTFQGRRTAGIITETEAYLGVNDRASHAYGGRRTARNEAMYADGGTAYIYLCYGIHHLFNVVVLGPDEPHAVLIRAIHPTEGLDIMLERRGQQKLTTGGPGTLSQALGIHTSHNGSDLVTGPIHLEDGGMVVEQADMIIGPRIGVDFAGEDALLPFRFRYESGRVGQVLPYTPT
ncbi:MAG: DNA-3-methyladenine glycosylase [Flavobacteriales bacterium]|nr:DNA-3-methyladenine glycosylase [Flavobacteriales bacterium]